MSDNRTGNVSVGCAQHSHVDFLRFFLIAGVSSPVAFLGVITNVCLLKFFAARVALRHSPTLYLAVLACLDALICAGYVLLFGADAAIHYLHLDWLYLAWTYYGIPLFAVSKVVQFASAYIIIAATVERWIIMLNEGHKIKEDLKQRHNKPRAQRWRRFYPQKPITEQIRDCLEVFSRPLARQIIILVIICMGFLTRFLITCFELEIQHFENCTAPGITGKIVIGMTEYTNTKIAEVINLYIVPWILIFIPFIVLFVTNLAIIFAMRRQFKQREILRAQSQHNIKKNTECHFEEDPDGEEQELVPLGVGLSAAGVFFQKITHIRERDLERKRINNATHTLIAIVVTYMVCNSLSLLIGILEKIPNKPLLEEDLVLPDGSVALNPEDGKVIRVWTGFYILTTDVISFLFMINSFIRPFIYLTFNPDLRREITSHFKRKPAGDELEGRRLEVTVNGFRKGSFKCLC